MDASSGDVSANGVAGGMVFASALTAYLLAPRDDFLSFLAPGDAAMALAMRSTRSPTSTGWNA